MTRKLIGQRGEHPSNAQSIGAAKGNTRMARSYHPVSYTIFAMRLQPRRHKWHAFKGMSAHRSAASKKTQGRKAAPSAWRRPCLQGGFGERVSPSGRGRLRLFGCRPAARWGPPASPPRRRRGIADGGAGRLAGRSPARASARPDPGKRPSRT